VITENFVLLAAMLCLVVGPTILVHLLHRRAEKRRRRDEERPPCSIGRRRRGRTCDSV